MISSSFTRHESIFCLQKLIPRRVNRNNNNNLHPRKNDKRPNHAVSILSNKKNTRFVLLNTPPISQNSQKISHLSRYRHQMVLTMSRRISLLQNLQHLPKTPCRESSAIVEQGVKPVPLGTHF
ncbi:hypothetical protein CDAR_286931 [Caerostris darwini]|uniref:Uncharacterized protein n=1 Tax=Caerostris darwini TaxID=1538125 RepID=A0AAV4RCY4_9ARAC|nr:hypothetical protein CDAR_286931 [Caerostris darwini]